jgi:uncharacterized repeat protein (TIGR03803 family)
VFKINLSTGVETVVHYFDWPNGVYPYSGLTSASGALYGTTSSGGSDSVGTIYKINPNNGNFSSIHSFSSALSGGGYSPIDGLVLWGGKLYGTTAYGGVSYNSGAIFNISPVTSAENTLLAFEATGGANSYASMVVFNGALYGTTTSTYGGAYPGSVFSASKRGGLQYVWTFQGDVDGGFPRAPLIAVGGALYGTTQMDGQGYGQGYGTVFKLVP